MLSVERQICSKLLDFNCDLTRFPPSQFIIFATFVALMHHRVDRRVSFNVDVQESTGRHTEEQRHDQTRHFPIDCRRILDRRLGGGRHQGFEVRDHRVGSGGAVGAAAGGPVGFIVGAAVGAWLGDQFNQQHQARNEFERNWMESETRVNELDDLLQGAELQVSTMESEVALLESRMRRETEQLRAAVRDALDVQVLFRTDEDTLPDETRQRLVRLAGALAGLDDMLVRIEGYADSRGETDHNEMLSAQRAAAVMETLIRAGVPAGPGSASMPTESSVRRRPRTIPTGSRWNGASS